MRKITKLIIHCSATPEGRDYTVADIDRWHRARGFKGIGYHYVIYRDGSVHPGRAVEVIGAHCTGQNANSIGICYIGGLAADGKTAKDTRTPAQREALRKLVAELKAKYPGVTVHGHREFANKACPCFDVKTQL
jgi:N-acetylmuramoyl-L-alanine amidase